MEGSHSTTSKGEVLSAGAAHLVLFFGLTDQVEKQYAE